MHFKQYVKTMVLGILFTILQGLDIVSTNIALKRGCVESNPILKKSVKSGFPIYLIIIKIGLGIYLTYLSVLFSSNSLNISSFGGSILNIMLIGLNLFVGAAVINNFVRIPNCGYSP